MYYTKRIIAFALCFLRSYRKTYITYVRTYKYLYNANTDCCQRVSTRLSGTTPFRRRRPTSVETVRANRSRSEGRQIVRSHDSIYDKYSTLVVHEIVAKSIYSTCDARPRRHIRTGHFPMNNATRTSAFTRYGRGPSPNVSVRLVYCLPHASLTGENNVRTHTYTVLPISLAPFLALRLQLRKQ